MRIGILIGGNVNVKELKRFHRVWIIDSEEYEAFTYAAILSIRYGINVSIFDVNTRRKPWQVAMLSKSLAEICEDFIISFKYKKGIEDYVLKVKSYLSEVKYGRNPKIYAITDDSFNEDIFDGVITRNRYLNTRLHKILISNCIHEYENEIICFSELI